MDDPTLLAAPPIARGALAPRPEARAGGAARLWLPWDATYAMRLEPGTPVLVALAGADGAPAPLRAAFAAALGLAPAAAPPGAEPGARAVAAEAWPHARVPARGAALSGALHRALGAPAEGAEVLVYARAPPASESTAGAVYARLLLHEEAAESAPPTPAASAVAPASGGRRGRTPPPPRGAASPAMRASAAAPPPMLANLLSSPSAAPPSSPSAVSPAPSAAGGAARRPLAAARDVRRAEAVLAAVLAGGGGADGRTRAAVAALLARGLAGQEVLAGNLAAVPVFGGTALFEIERAPGRPPWAPARVGADTAVHLLAPGEAAPTGGAHDAASSSAGTVRAAAAAAAAAVGGGADGPAARAAAAAATAGARATGAAFASLGGAAAQKRALRELVAAPLAGGAALAALGLGAPAGVLLHGPPGTGKTALARAAAAEAGAALLVLNGPDVLAAAAGESEAGLRGVFAAARAAAPAVIFLDEVDALAPARGGASGGAGAGGGAAARLVAALAGEMDALAAAGARVAVLAATNRVEALDTALRRPGRFDREVEVPAPSPAERVEILEVFLARLAHALPPAAAARLAADAHGFVAADLEALCADAAMGALRRAVAGGTASSGTSGNAPAGAAPLRVLEADFAAARARARPSALREVGLEVPRVRWADIGGGAALKRQLREAVEWPFSRGAALAALGAAPPRGVLLFGPPGCSKTLLARAVAAEAGLSFLAVKGGELLSKYLGESERALAAVFRRARAAAPAVVFFDELDGLVGWRAAGGASNSGDGVSVGDRVLATLLQEMDGLAGPGGGAPVVVLGATNRPDRLDAALLRPGRFDRLLYVPPPDAAARREILELHARGTPLLADVDLNAVADGAEGRSGADLAALLRRAALLALEEDMGAPGVGARHLAAAAAEAPAPGASAELLASYARFRRQVDCD